RARTRPPRPPFSRASLRASDHVEEHRLGVLEQTDELVGERGADVAVDETMIEAQREEHDIADDDLIAADDGFLFHLVDTEDGDLGEVDDRGGEEAALLAE